MSPLETHMQTISGLVSGQNGPQDLDPLMMEGAKAGPRARVYRNSSLLAASDALKSNYSATAAIMGDEFFGAMARAFVDANRTQSRTLVGYGAELPDFIAAAQGEHGLPWLADMARLDRAWLAAHLAADDAALAPDAFAQMAQDEAVLMAARLALGPSVALVQGDWQVFELWAAIRRDNVPEIQQELAQVPQTVLIWRRAGEVNYRLLSLGEAAFLSAVKIHSPLEQAAEAGLTADPEFDIGQALAAAISRAIFTRA